MNLSIKEQDDLVISLLPEFRKIASKYLLRFYDKEDGAHELLFHVLKRLRSGKCTENTNIIGWCVTVAYNKAKDICRRNNKKSYNASFDDDLNPAPEPLDKAPEIISGIINRETVESVREHIAKEFGEDRFEMLKMRGMDVSYVEIGMACGIPVGTVMSRLHRMRQSLQKAA